MIQISQNAAHHVRSDLVHNLYVARDRRAGVLAKAREPLPEALQAFAPEQASLVAHLEDQCERDASKIAKLEAALPGLEQAAQAAIDASAEFVRAKAAHLAGSADRKEALRLRDDFEAADQAMRVRKREVADLAARMSATLPMTPNVEDTKSDPVVGIANWVYSHMFYPDRTTKSIEQERLAPWNEMPEEKMHLIPLAAVLTIEDFKRETNLSAKENTAWKAFFCERLVKFKTDRAKYLHDKAATAEREASEARARVAQLQVQP